MTIKELKKYLFYNEFIPTRFYTRRDGGFGATSCNKNREYEGCNCNLNLRYMNHLKNKHNDDYHCNDNLKCHCENPNDMDCNFSIVRNKFRIIKDEYDGCDADRWAVKNELKVSL